MAEVLSHHADGAEVVVQVNESVARMAGYLIGGSVHANFDSQNTRKSVELRPYQLNALNNMDEQHAQGTPRTLLDMGMGLGKTTIALADTLIFCEKVQEAGEEPPASLWMAHSVFLLKQARNRLLQMCPDADTQIISSSRDQHRAQHIFATLQLMDKIKDNFDPRTYRRITVDESHHGPAPTYAEAISHFEPDYLLGMTGTAYRTDGQILSDLFGDTVYRMPMTRGIAEGWLVPLDYRLQVDQAVRRIMNSPEGMGASPAVLAAPNRYRAIRGVIRKTQAEVENARTMIFTPGKRNSRLLAELMPEVDLLDSGVSPQEQEENIEKYRIGPTGSLVTIDMASEGMDFPETNIIALLRMTDARGLFEQQIGRGVRPAEGKDRLIVLDFVANGQRLYMLHRFLEDIRNEYRRYHIRRFKEANPGVEPDETVIAEAVNQSTKSINVTFTEQQLDIIDRMRELHEAPPPKKDWMNTRSLGFKWDTTPNMIASIIKDLRLEGTIMFDPKAGAPDLFYSPVQQSYISLAIAWNKQTGEWDTYSSLRQKTGKGNRVLTRVATELGVRFRPLRIGSIIGIISPKDGAAIAAECMKEGMTLSELAIRSGKNRHQVRKAIAKLAVTGKDVGGKEGAPTIVYPSDDCSKILDELGKLEVLEPMPDGYTPSPEARKAFPDAGLDRLMKEASVSPGRYSNARNQSTQCFSPDEMVKLTQAYDKIEKGTPIAKVAEQFSISEQKARGLAVEVFGKERTRLTGDEIEALGKAPYIVASAAPPTYKRKTRIMSDAGIQSQQFERAVKELGIQPDEYKASDINRPLLLPHYSPTEEAAIVMHAKGDEAGAQALLQGTNKSPKPPMPLFQATVHQAQKSVAPVTLPSFFFGHDTE